MDVSDADIRDRYVGNRYYNTEIDEAFTVIGYDGMFLLLQYDDGVFWDEAPSPHAFGDEVGAHLGLSDAGIDSAKYQPLGTGPTIDQVCDEGAHEFYPPPSQLGITTSEDFASVGSTYHNVCRCKRCGLSASTLIEYTGHDVPGVCDRCDTDIMPGEDEKVLQTGIGATRSR